MQSRGSWRSRRILGSMSRALMAGLVCVLFCSSLKASAWVELQLAAPQECPSREAIETALNRLVQRPPQSPLRVSARLAPDGNRWVLLAVFENGQRVIPGDSCLAVAEALVAILALAIDPTASVQSTDLSTLTPGNAPSSGTTHTPGALGASGAPNSPSAPGASIAPGLSDAAPGAAGQPAAGAPLPLRPTPAVTGASGVAPAPANLAATAPNRSVPQRQNQAYCTALRVDGG